MLKLAYIYTQMYMWDNSNCPRGREKNADGRDRNNYFLLFRRLLEYLALLF